MNFWTSGVSISRRRIGKAIAGIVVWVVLVVVTGLTSFIPPPYGIIIATGASLLSFRYSDKLLDLVFGKEGPSKLRLEVRFLPHHRGYMLPLKVEVKDLGDGRKEASATNTSAASSLEYASVEPCQKIEGYWGSIDQPMKELIVKFGVIRVHCVSDEAIGCRAEARIKRIEEFGRRVEDRFRPVGYLNWYSVAKKSEVIRNLEAIDKERGYGLNEYLRNTVEDLHTGDEKDLLAFYVIKDMPNVYLCTDALLQNAGMLANSKPVKFELEMSLTAQRYPRTPIRYMVTVKAFDEYLVEQIGH